MTLAAVTFDVTHTLLACPALGQQYADVLARHGIAVLARDVEAAIPLVWQELSCIATPARDRFVHHPKGARGFWRHFVERTCELIDAPRPSAFAAAELFDRFSFSYTDALIGEIDGRGGSPAHRLPAFAGMPCGDVIP